MSLVDLLLFHGIGGNEMPYRRSYYPSTRTTVRRRSRKKKGGLGLGSLANFGQARSLRANFDSIKSVLYTGMIAAGGAVLTERVFKMLPVEWNLTGYKGAGVKVAIGIAMGLVIAKVLKKPKIAAAFAIGPVVSAVMDIVNMLTTQREVAGLNMITANVPTAYDPTSMYAGMPALSEVVVGPGNPDWMSQSTQAAAYPFPG